MSETNKNTKNNAFDKIFKDKKIRFFIVAVLAILVFVIMFCNFSDGNKDSSQTDEVTAYVNNLEKTLSEMLTEIDGAGKVKVAISVASGRETVLATKTTITQTESGTQKEETPIIVNGKTVVLKELYPEITGVLIIAEGADSIKVLNKIQQATTSLLNIDINRIEILTMK